MEIKTKQNYYTTNLMTINWTYFELLIFFYLNQGVIMLLIIILKLILNDLMLIMIMISYDELVL